VHTCSPKAKHCACLNTSNNNNHRQFAPTCFAATRWLQSSCWCERIHWFSWVSCVQMPAANSRTLKKKQCTKKNALSYDLAHLQRSFTCKKICASTGIPASQYLSWTVLKQPRMDLRILKHTISKHTPNIKHTSSHTTDTHTHHKLQCFLCKYCAKLEDCESLANLV